MAVSAPGVFMHVLRNLLAPDILLVCVCVVCVCVCVVCVCVCVCARARVRAFQGCTHGIWRFPG